MRTMTLSAALACLVFAAACHTAQAEEGRLSKDEVFTMLENMGYAVKKTTVENGYYITMTHQAGDLSLTYNVVMSKDGTKIWFQQTVISVTDENRARIPWPKLVSAQNTHTGTCMFQYAESARAVYLAIAVENRSVKPADIRQSVDNLGAAVVATRDLWEEKNWPVTNTVGMTQR
ncbi:MAG: hypothetical protein KIS92_11015 [Planctomycetota bacterium]|nr:hypothetical protein [Planctomycetota bacterium]